MRHNGTATAVGAFNWIIVTILWNKFFMYSVEVFFHSNCLPNFLGYLIFKEYDVISLPGTASSFTGMGVYTKEDCLTCVLLTLS